MFGHYGLQSHTFPENTWCCYSYNLPGIPAEKLGKAAMFMISRLKMPLIAIGGLLLVLVVIHVC